jgi:hypothetical protein
MGSGRGSGRDVGWGGDVGAGLASATGVKTIAAGRKESSNPRGPWPAMVVGEKALAAAAAKASAWRLASVDVSVEGAGETVEVAVLVDGLGESDRVAGGNDAAAGPAGAAVRREGKVRRNTMMCVSYGPPLPLARLWGR